MATSKGYLQFILDQLSGLEEITFRAMYPQLPAPKPRKSNKY